MKANSWVACFVAAVAMLLAGCAATTPPPPGAGADPSKAQITVLYDAFGKSSAMQKDWGYAALIEYGGKRILFDTGNNSDLLARNVKAKGIDLSTLDFVVMSHRHGDHMGGMAYLLSVNPRVKIYAPKEGFGVYGADLPSTFYRKDASLPPEQRYYDGAPPEVMRFGAAWPGANFQLIDKNTEIAPGIHLIALVSDKPGTLELRELSLAINTPDGIVIVVGCSHPGIDKIVAAAAVINPRIHFIAGGFHLVASSDQEIEKIVATLRDTFKVAFVAPGHCTGEPTFTALKKAFGDRYLYAGLGTTFALGATPRSISDTGHNAPTGFSTVTEKLMMIPMRDGKHLSAYVYFPPGNGPWPAIFEQRYSDLSGAGTRRNAAKLAEKGYVVAMVNFRGAHLSEGTWVGYRALAWGELKDGYDIVEWFAKQPWCSGKIGTYGGSQAGYAQNFLAVTQPPHLVAQYMTDTGLSLYQEGYRIGGITRPERFKKMGEAARDPADNLKLINVWFQHPTYDEYWMQEDCTLHFGKMNVPCFTIGSWYDFMNQGSIQSFVGRQHQGGPNSRGQQQLVIGPWLHGGYPKPTKVGDMVFPDDAGWDVYGHMAKWFDHYLKGVENGVEKDPPVRYYVMGATGEPDSTGNVWRSAKDWPLPSRAVSMFLHEGGGLSLTPPKDEKSWTSYISDPHHPMSIPGTSFPGAKDARPFEQQAEVRTFTSDVLTEPVEWTGQVKAELYVSSTARDTDFIVRLSDVYPDGRSILIMDYPRRARYREGFTKEVLMEPGKVYPVPLEVGWVSQVFNRGHRIRVTVASTGAPLYEPNPQNGEALTIEFPSNAVVATNRIHHEREYASRIIAPVAK